MNRKLTLALTIFLLCCFWYLDKGDNSTAKELGYEIIPFKDVPGLSKDTLKNEGITFGVDNDVIKSKNENGTIYSFYINKINIPGVSNRQFELEGTPEDFNHFVLELNFLKTQLRTEDRIWEIGKGGFDAVEEMVKGILDMVLHPIDSGKNIIDGLWETGKKVFDVLTGQTTLAEVEDSVKRFAKFYWENIRAKKAQENGLELEKILLDETSLKIDLLAKPYLSGALLTEALTIYFSFSKIGKIKDIKYAKDLSRFEKMSELTKLFKYLKFKEIQRAKILMSKEALALRSGKILRAREAVMNKPKIWTRALEAFKPFSPKLTETTTRQLTLSSKTTATSRNLLDLNYYRLQTALGSIGRSSTSFLAAPSKLYQFSLPARYASRSILHAGIAAASYSLKNPITTIERKIKDLIFTVRGVADQYRKFEIVDSSGNLIGVFRLRELYRSNRVVRMRFVGEKSSVSATARGFERNKKFFWDQYLKMFPNDLSSNNTQLIALGRSPVVDDQWLKIYPNHARFKGESLEHHHLNHGGDAIPLPTTLHNRLTNRKVWHYE